MGNLTILNHCIIGVISDGIAALGADGVEWEGKAVSQVFAACVVTPAVVGAIRIIVFTITEHGVLKRQNPLRAGFWMIPWYCSIPLGILTMVIVWKESMWQQFHDTTLFLLTDMITAPLLELDEWSTG